jgi:methylenetetrahydrofolate dehydrogenase (NADP+)/methenyltetrahydrofolate cyclohydrolase
VTATLLDGAAVARAIKAEVAEEVRALSARGVRPGLGVLLVGDNPASAIYVRSKTRSSEELGMHHETAHLPASATTEEVVARVDDYNRRGEIHGILVQLPLPPQVDAERVLRLVDPAKDVDGFHPCNVGLLVQKRPRFVACTPAGIMELLARSGIAVSGRRAVVLGRSDIVGKPMALLLMHADATVTVCHSRTRDLPAVTREADLLVAAIGKAGLVRAEFVKPGAVVVDVGMNRIEDPAQARELLDEPRLEDFGRKGYALVGDVHAPSVREVAGALTPVPGGVGPLTIALLMKNTAMAAKQANDHAVGAPAGRASLPPERD